MADEKTFKLKIISPDRLFYEDDVTMIELGTTEGEMGVYAGHIPLTSVLVPDTIKIHKGEEIRKAALHSGFIEILPDSVTVLAEIAEWPEEIDVNRANEARIRAERRPWEMTTLERTSSGSSSASSETLRVNCTPYF